MKEGEKEERKEGRKMMEGRKEDDGSKEGRCWKKDEGR